MLKISPVGTAVTLLSGLVQLFGRVDEGVNVGKAVAQTERLPNSGTFPARNYGLANGTYLTPCVATETELIETI